MRCEARVVRYAARLLGSNESRVVPWLARVHRTTGKPTGTCRIRLCEFVLSLGQLLSGKQGVLGVLKRFVSVLAGQLKHKTCFHKGRCVAIYYQCGIGTVAVSTAPARRNACIGDGRK